LSKARGFSRGGGWARLDLTDTLLLQTSHLTKHSKSFFNG
jgi:hypothetical protein